MNPRSRAAYLTLAVAASVAGTVSLYQKYGSQTAAPSAQALARRVLLELPELRNRPEAREFIADLEADAELARAVDSGLDNRLRTRFESLVARHALNPAFVKAVKTPAAETAPCDAAPTPTASEPAASQTTDSLAPIEPGCSKDDPKGLF